MDSFGNQGRPQANQGNNPNSGFQWDEVQGSAPYTFPQGGMDYNPQDDSWGSPSLNAHMNGASGGVQNNNDGWEDYDFESNGGNTQTGWGSSSVPQQSSGWDFNESTVAHQNTFADFGNDGMQNRQPSQNTFADFGDVQSSGNFSPNPQGNFADFNFDAQSQSNLGNNQGVYQSNQNQTGTETQEDYWGRQAQFQNKESKPKKEPKPKKEVNLSYKMAGIVAAGILIVLAIIFLILDNIHIDKKPDTDTDTQQQVQEKVETSRNKVELIEIPASTALDYSGEVFETDGKIVSKDKYLIGNQVVYCLSVELDASLSTEPVRYYCTYSSFSKVQLKESVLVRYQVPQKCYISIFELTR